jgi:hypothetical protein
MPSCRYSIDISAPRRKANRQGRYELSLCMGAIASGLFNDKCPLFEDSESYRKLYLSSGDARSIRAAHPDLDTWMTPGEANAANMRELEALVKELSPNTPPGFRFVPLCYVPITKNLQENVVIVYHARQVVPASRVTVE